MAKIKHTHKYHKITLAFGQVWKCGDEDCTHFMPNNLTPVLLGRASICWECGEKFKLNSVNMLKDRPVCDDCNPSIESMAALLNKMGVK
jgi:hypothetical protein